MSLMYLILPIQPWHQYTLDEEMVGLGPSSLGSSSLPSIMMYSPFLHTPMIGMKVQLLHWIQWIDIILYRYRDGIEGWDVLITKTSSQIQNAFTLFGMNMTTVLLLRLESPSTTGIYIEDNVFVSLRMVSKLMILMIQKQNTSLPFYPAENR